MPDLDKLFEKAEKYRQKEKYKSALDTYLEIHKHKPNDEDVLLNLSDLCLKLDRPADALRYQSLLVDLYIKRNDVSKAVAACRKILKSSPQEVTTLTKMAALLEKSQQAGEALKAYRQALTLYRGPGATQQALECLQHIVQLDPSDLEAHIELGEQASRSHQPKTATTAFLQAAQLARRAGQEDRWGELVQRAHSADSQDEAACLAAAELNLKKDQAAKSVSLLEPLVQRKPDDLATLELLTKAYLGTNDYAKAEPLCWKLYQAHPEGIDFVLELANRLAQTGQPDKALAFAGRFKDQLLQQGKRDEFLKIMEKIYAADESNLEILEALSGLYNELNKDDGLHRSLLRLFNLTLASEQYEKAAETLDRIIDMDPYGEGHHDRLLNLEGHVDPVRYNNILLRIEVPTGGRKPGNAAGGVAATTQETEALEDLIIEGEMYHQYLLASKLKETLEKINRLYPGAEESNSRLHELYQDAGFAPTPAPAAERSPAVSAPPAPKPEPSRPQAAPSPYSLEDLKKSSEITASIYRESTPQGVTQVAVNEIGRALNASRCWAALGAADRPPTLTVEYCSPSGASASDMAAALKVYASLVRQAATSPDGWSVEDVGRAPIFAPVASEIQKLGIKSLLALPLIDREEPAGLLLVEQCDQPRSWTDREALLVKAIATQVVIAVNNTKLRRLVRSLAGSDGEPGLLPRSSYLDCLLAEAQRAKELSRSLSVCLLEPENPGSLVKGLGDAGVQQYFQQAGKALQSNLRQNDVAIRYSPYCIAVVFPDTALPQGGLAVEKLRRILSQVKLDAAAVPTFCSVVCEVHLGPNFDAVDGVTEVINRLETALDQAHKEGGKRILLSKFEE